MPAMWASFYNIVDLSPDEVWEGKSVIRRNGHWFKRGGNRRILVGQEGTYGNFREWEETTQEEENELQYDWRNKGNNGDTTASKDYYVVMSLNPHEPVRNVDVNCGSFYNTRMFVHGRCLETEEPLPRYKLMLHLQAIGLRTGADYWDPVIIQSGYKDGFPRFDIGLRAETHYGPTWGDLQTRILEGRKLPNGYRTDYYPESIGARIYTDVPIDLNKLLDTPGAYVSNSTMKARIRCYREMDKQGYPHDQCVEAAKQLIHVS